jgi:hypothetical protein
MDDILILTETKKQFSKAKKRTFQILRNLRLTVSSHKSRIGKLDADFHFLGVNFALTRISQSKSQVDVRVHSRTPRRALDKVKALSSRRTSGAHAAIP